MLCSVFRVYTSFEAINNFTLGFLSRQREDSDRVSQLYHEPSASVETGQHELL